MYKNENEEIELLEYKFRNFNPVSMEIFKIILDCYNIHLTEAIIGGGLDCSIYTRGTINPRNNRFTLNLRVEKFYGEFHLVITNLSMEKIRTQEWNFVIKALKEYGKQIHVKFIKTESTICKKELDLYKRNGFEEYYIDEYYKPLRLEIEK